MNFTYISIPKTASRSVHRALKDKSFNNHLPIKNIDSIGFSFTFFKNPSDRIISWYNSSRYDYPHESILKNIYGDDINDWIENGCPHHWHWYCNPLYQWEFVEINNKLEVDFIGDFEKIDMQLQYLSDNYLKLGKMNIPRLGVSKLSRPILSEMSIKKLNELFPKDYQMYNKIKKDGFIRK